MPEQDITNDQGGDDEDNSPQDEPVSGVGLKFLLGSGRLAVAPQNHCLIYPFRALIAAHQQAAA